MGKILVVDDEEDIRSFLAEALTSDGHTVEQADNGQTALRLLQSTYFDGVLTDLKMPGMSGMELVAKLRKDQPDVEVIMLTAHGSVDSAVEAMKLGAFDYLQKPIQSPAELRLVVSRMLERKRMIVASDHAKRQQPEIRLTWGDPAMKPAVESMRKVAKTAATVLLVGESGTGKEVAARCVHNWSDRFGGPFVAINCASLTDTLLESELFGHEKGAFTGAHEQRRGRIELAHGGTFFLDEVGELKTELQAKLLRVIQERQFQRVGGTRVIDADVRWIAATNQDLSALMQKGTFREDLYHRLAVFPIHLPPLRERSEDIQPLALALFDQVSCELGKPNLKLSEPAIQKLRSASWPGNVRELRNALERAVIIADGRSVTKDDIQIDRTTARATPQTTQPATLANLERAAIVAALQESGNNRKQAAQTLGIALRTLYDKLKRYDIK